MSAFLAFTVFGIVIGAAYAIAASGLVITYATSNVFNMAHGAVGMVMAFLFWELAANQGLPLFLALIVVVGVAAPLFGAVVERTMMRRLTDAPTMVSLTVTVGLLVALIGVAQTAWPPAGRQPPEFFKGTTLQLGEAFITGQDVLTFVLALAVAGGLYHLLNRTRTGIAMRAIVDDRRLVALHGARPHRLGMLSWAIGSALAALAGILLTSRLGLDYISLTLLVVNAYAAAMVGRLKNLPRTFVGAMILGLLSAYALWLLPRFVGLLPQDLGAELEDYVGGFRAALPTIMLFAVMLLLPLERLRAGRVRGASLVRLPSRAKAITAGVVLIAAVVGLTSILTRTNTAQLGQSLALSTIMLSLVLLTGYGGDVSLGQMTFVGIGAVVVARWMPSILGTEAVASPLAILLAGLAAGVLGVIVAIPALRLRGLYLALGTLAFAVAMDKLVFQREIAFSFGGGVDVQRPTILGISLASERAFAIFVAVGFVLLGWFVLAIRRGRFGRFVLAARDSEAACGTLGLSVTSTRVALFGVSAAMAGVGGALYAGMNVSVGATDFAMFQSLPLLLMAVIGGVTSVTGALLGGVLYGMSPVITDSFPQLGGIINLLIGAAAIGLGHNPNGVAGWLFSAADHVRSRPEQAPSRVATTSDERATEEVTAVGAP